MPCKKRGRPPGKARTLHCLDEQCNIVCQPLKPPAEFRRAVSENTEVSDVIFGQTDQADFELSPAQGLSPHLASQDFGLPSPPEIYVSPSAPASAAGAALLTEVNECRVYAQQLLTMALQPLNCSQQSSRQACFCVPDWNQSKQKLNYSKFLLPAVRLTEMADGQQHLVWWCSCDHQLDSNRAMFAYHDYTSFSVEYLEGRADQCIHLQALEVHCSCSNVV